jgi:hypothetical protein
LTFFVEDSRARTSLQQVREQELPENVRDYGRNMRDSLARCGLDLSLPKTHHCFALGDLELSSKTWPRWGIMLDGELSELGTLKHLTSENECGFLPTPQKGDAAATINTPSQNQTMLAHWVQAEKGNGEKLHPEFAEAVMGWPQGWTDLKQLETDKFRSVQLWHSTFSQKD